MVPINEFRDGDQLTVKIGDQVDVLVKQLRTTKATSSSSSRCPSHATWDRIEQAYRRGTTLSGRVMDRIKAVCALISAVFQHFSWSQVDIRPVRNLDSFRNKEIEVVSSRSTRSAAT
jgi:small subunit ribosomal protein S1